MDTVFYNVKGLRLQVKSCAKDRVRKVRKNDNMLIPEDGYKTASLVITMFCFCPGACASGFLCFLMIPIRQADGLKKDWISAFAGMTREIAASGTAGETVAIQTPRINRGVNYICEMNA